MTILYGLGAIASGLVTARLAVAGLDLQVETRRGRVVLAAEIALLAFAAAVAIGGGALDVVRGIGGR